MSIAQFLTETINGIFKNPNVTNAQASTASLIDRATNEPMMVVLLLALGLSVCAFLMGLVVFFRRPSDSHSDDLIDQRLQVIEALLRDHAAARSFFTKKLSGEMEYFRRELSDIRATIEYNHDSVAPQKRVSNG